MYLCRLYPARRCGSCGRLMHFAPDVPECAECEARGRIKRKDSVRDAVKMRAGQTARVGAWRE